MGRTVWCRFCSQRWQFSREARPYVFASVLKCSTRSGWLKAERNTGDVAAFERIFGATIFFGTDTQGPRARVVHRSRFNFLREAQIWYNRDPAQPCLSEE